MYPQPKQSVTVRVCGSIGVLEAKYAYSVDARHWLVSPRQTYSYDVKYTGPPGSRLFTRVERPQLGFFGSGSSPTHLYNGVCYATTASSIYGCLELISPNASVMTCAPRSPDLQQLKSRFCYCTAVRMLSLPTPRH